MSFEINCVSCCSNRYDVRGVYVIMIWHTWLFQQCYERDNFTEKYFCGVSTGNVDKLGARVFRLK